MPESKVTRLKRLERQKKGVTGITGKSTSVTPEMGLDTFFETGLVLEPQGSKHHKNKMRIGFANGEEVQTLSLGRDYFSPWLRHLNNR